MIADDSAEMRWLVREAIGHEFAEVVEVADGRALLWNLLRSSMKGMPTSLLVTDLAMPGYTGLDVLDAWQELPIHVPTILITAFPSAAVRERAAAVGAVMLAKPFSTAALRRAVNEVCHGRHDR